MRAAQVLQRVNALFAVLVGRVRMRFMGVLMVFVVVLMAATAVVLMVMFVVVLMAAAAVVLVVMLVMMLMAAGAGILVMVLMVMLVGMMVLMLTATRRGVGMFRVIFSIFRMHMGMRCVFGRSRSRAGLLECHRDGLLLYI